jgi:hypothetical protein
VASILGKLLGRKTSFGAQADSHDALLAQAKSAAQSRDFRRALELYERAIAIDPSSSEAHYQRGNALRNLGDLGAAVASYDRAGELRGDFAQAFCNRGAALHGLGLVDQALSSYDRAIAIDPGDAMAHYNRALLMQDCCRWAEALASYDRAVSIDPQFADAQFNRALALLFCGDFEQGWRGHEWRWRVAERLGIGQPRQFEQPLWLGKEPIEGKRLLLHSEAGLGDTLQFCRYAPLAAARGAIVLLEVQAPLAGLLSRLQGVCEVAARGAALPPFDCHCPMMSLPLAFETTLATIPAAPGYLRADAHKVARWRSRLAALEGPRVGLAWSGNAANAIDARRSIRLADLTRHLPSGVQYFCTQRDVRAEDRATLAQNPWIHYLNDDAGDFDDAAALCDCMDLIVSVDTSIAHLCGALGRPTWILLPFQPDWRWMRDRGDSPWYPTVTLYRQSAAGDWESVLARLGADIRRRFRLG